jgi:hypothetical protein
MVFALCDMTSILDGIYPSDGFILSSDGELSFAPPVLIFVFSSIFNIGQIEGISISSMLIVNFIPFLLARVLAASHIYFFCACISPSCIRLIILLYCF